jgi:hypothetical protein
MVLKTNSDWFPAQHRFQMEMWVLAAVALRTAEF